MLAKITLGALVAAIFILGVALTPSAIAAPSDDACSLLTPAQLTVAVGVSVGAGQYVGTSKKTCT
jgi:hypothetical protein